MTDQARFVFLLVVVGVAELVKDGRFNLEARGAKRAVMIGGEPNDEVGVAEAGGHTVVFAQRAAD